MGCWDETCALSGLPIYGGDECCRIVFNEDKVEELAFCAIDNPTELFSWVQGIEFGKYDDYGRVKNTKDCEDIGDAVVFVLKHFWDLAPTMTPEYATETIERHMKNRQACRELVGVIGESGRDIVNDLLNINGSPLMDSSPELYAGFVHVAWWMSMLRRTFYTGAYRGAQSAMSDFVLMNKHINDYIKEKN